MRSNFLVSRSAERSVRSICMTIDDLLGSISLNFCTSLLSDSIKMACWKNG